MVLILLAPEKETERREIAKKRETNRQADDDTLISKKLI